VGASHPQKGETKQNKTKQNKTKQNKTKQNKTKQNKTKQKICQLATTVTMMTTRLFTLTMMLPNASQAL
jgi:energy-converting hydrogenase Eha subunit H